MLDPSARIYVAGHTGLVGSALVRTLHASGYRNLLLRCHHELDLTNQSAVARFFSTERPEYVFLAAAKVGGIYANNTYPADFIAQNLAIQSNVIQQSYETGVQRLLFLGSSCIYPKHCPQPIKEDYLLSGPLEPTNQPYAIAKIAGIEMCAGFNRQHQTRFLAAMPTNLFGEGDNYDLQTSHVVPALIRKMSEATQLGWKSVTVWGTGTAKREFLYSDDLADACLFLMRLSDASFHQLIDSARSSVDQHRVRGRNHDPRTGRNYRRCSWISRELGLRLQQARWNSSKTARLFADDVSRLATNYPSASGTREGMQGLPANPRPFSNS